MKKNNGFSLIEVLISAGIIFMIAITLIPLISFVNAERASLSLKRVVSNELHDHLQVQIWSTSFTPIDFSKDIRNHEITFTFDEDSNNLIKGCANWVNVNQKEESLCIYGLPEN